MYLISYSISSCLEKLKLSDMPLYLETILQMLKKLPPKGIFILMSSCHKNGVRGYCSPIWHAMSMQYLNWAFIILTFPLLVDIREIQHEFDNSDDESASSSQMLQVLFWFCVKVSI